jgi:hypothetical protein
MPVGYSNAVKKPNQKISYTSHMIKEMEKCMNDIIYFTKYVKIIDPDRGKITLFDNLRDYQIEFLNQLKDNRKVIGLWSRQSSKTTCIAVFYLWYALFNNDILMGLVSNKESGAKDILKRIKSSYEELPVWLKCGVVSYNMKSIVFENNTEILVSATSADAFRGRTLRILTMDEAAFVKPKSILSDFWSANFPALSASNQSKIFVISTPNGVGDLFYTLWQGAINEKNGFLPSRVHWWQVPGRDEEWKKEQQKVLSELEWQREYECVFLGSANTVIDSKILEELLSLDKDPIKYDLNDRLRIYEYPLNDKKYVVSVDSAKGTGEHYSTIQILKINSISPFKLEQVAVFQDNHTDIYLFADIVYKLALYYNNAHIMVENNAEGSVVVNKLWWDYEYEKLVNESTKRTGLGIRATKITKPKAVIIMKKLIENHDLILKDKNTIDELTTFVETSNNIFKGKDDKTDDLVSALYWGCFISEFELFEEDVSINTETEEGWGILTDVEIENVEWDFL